MTNIIKYFRNLKFHKVSICLQKGCLFEFPAHIVAKTINVEVDWSASHFSQNNSIVWFE